MKFIRALVELVIVLVLIMLGVQNYDVISLMLNFKINFGPLGAWQLGPISVGVLLLLALFLGGCFVGLYGIFEYLKLRNKYQQALRKVSFYGESKPAAPATYEEPALSAQPVEGDES